MTVHHQTFLNLTPSQIGFKLIEIYRPLTLLINANINILTTESVGKVCCTLYTNKFFVNNDNYIQLFCFGERNMYVWSMEI